MADLTVTFTFRPGIASSGFENVRLCGNWGGKGRDPSEWSTVEMTRSTDVDGFEVFRAEISFPEDQVGTTFRWGVLLGGPAGRDLWAVAAEVDDEHNVARERSFVLAPDTPGQKYSLTWCDRLGAVRLPSIEGQDGIRFSVWAPNACKVELVLADPAIGYIADDGTGTARTISMVRTGEIWTAGPETDLLLTDFEAMVGHTLHVPHHQG